MGREKGERRFLLSPSPQRFMVIMMRIILFLPVFLRLIGTIWGTRNPSGTQFGRLPSGGLLARETERDEGGGGAGGGARRAARAAVAFCSLSPFVETLLQPAAEPCPHRELNGDIRGGGGCSRGPSLSADRGSGARNPPDPSWNPSSASPFVAFLQKKKKSHREGSRSGSGVLLCPPPACEQPICCSSLKRFGPRCSRAQMALPRDAADPFRAPAARLAR